MIIPLRKRLAQQGPRPTGGIMKPLGLSSMRLSAGNLSLPFGAPAGTGLVSSPGQLVVTIRASNIPPVGAGSISIDSGVIVRTERDFATADGLLRVERLYRRQQRSSASVDIKSEIPGFGQKWHGLVPGRLTASGDLMERLAFLTPEGTTVSFTISAAADPSNWTYSTSDSTRLKASVVGSVVGDRVAYLKDGAAVAGGPGELRLSFANGDYVLFRRAESYDSVAKSRYLVPIEQGLANGYKQFFDYRTPASFRIRFMTASVASSR